MKSGEWAEDFMKLLCTKRRVYMETAVFAKGAALCAADRLRPQTSYPYAMICEGHLKASVTMQVLHKGQDTAVTLGQLPETAGERVEACWR